MAVTRQVSVGPSWVLLASARDRGEIVELQASSDIAIAVTVGRKPAAPELPVGTGHRVTGSDSVPLTSSQHLWASASAPATVTVN